MRFKKIGKKTSHLQRSHLKYFIFKNFDVHATLGDELGKNLTRVVEKFSDPPVVKTWQGLHSRDGDDVETFRRPTNETTTETCSRRRRLTSDNNTRGDDGDDSFEQKASATHSQRDGEDPWDSEDP